MKENSNIDIGEDFGPKFDEKDVIGCGLLITKKEIFYTKNGAFIGTAFKDVKIHKMASILRFVYNLYLIIYSQILEDRINNTDHLFYLI